MTVGIWKIYDDAAKALITNGIDLMNDSIKCALFSNTMVPDRTDSSYSSLSGEIASGNGYTTGGIALANPAVTTESNVSTFSTDKVIFTASGGSISARYGVIYDDTHATKMLIACVLLDIFDNDVVKADGDALGILINLFTISGGW